MGASLKQRVIAEGVEKPGQLAFLKRSVARRAGYFFSRPLVAGGIRRAARNRNTEAALN